MPTCRLVIMGALRALKAIGPGEGPHIDQMTAGLVAVQNLILELHEARGALRDVDVSGPWVANENTRCRVEAGSTVVVTLPNAVPMFDGFDPYDYGFDPATDPWSAYAPQGTTAPADNIQYRQPRDGARIEIVGTTSQLFFYRADINQWVSAHDLRLDDEIPLNARYAGPFGTLTAERFMEDLSVDEPTPGFARRAAGARSVIFNRVGTRRGPVRAEYF